MFNLNEKVLLVYEDGREVEGTVLTITKVDVTKTISVMVEDEGSNKFISFKESPKKKDEYYHAVSNPKTKRWIRSEENINIIKL